MAYCFIVYHVLYKYLQISISWEALGGLHFFSLSTLTWRHSPLWKAERAWMPETALLSAFTFCFLKIQAFKSPLFGEFEIFASPLFKTPFLGGIPHTTRTPSPVVTCGTVQLFFARKFHHTRGPSLMISARLITSSAQLRPAAQRRAVTFPGVPCRAVPYCAMLCGPVPCCAVLCRVGGWFAGFIYHFVESR